MNTKIVLSDPGNNARVQLTLTGLTITASGNWDGLFQSPELLSTNTGIHLSDGNIITAESLYQIGSSTIPLALSGKLANIDIKTSQPNGTTMKVYRSDNIWVSFLEIGSCVVTGGICSFTTNHFSQFALGNPVSPLISIIPIGLSGGGGPVSYTNAIAHYSNQLSLQNILNKTTLPSVLSDSKGIISSVDWVIISLQKYAILSYLDNVHYDLQEKASENAQRYLVDPIITKISHWVTRGQKLLWYDFALHALNTKRGSSKTSTFELTILSTAFQKISDARLKYIQKTFL